MSTELVVNDIFQIYGIDQKTDVAGLTALEVDLAVFANQRARDPLPARAAHPAAEGRQPRVDLHKRRVELDPDRAPHQRAPGRGLLLEAPAEARALFHEVRLKAPTSTKAPPPCWSTGSAPAPEKSWPN